MSNTSLKSQLESILFIASKPVTVSELAKVTSKTSEVIQEALRELEQDYTQESRGVELIETQGKYQLVTAGKNAEVVKKFSHTETSGELTKPALETLTIVSYRGPITKLELEKIRGVNCGLILKNLLLRGLIEEKFDQDTQATYYNITLEFLKFLGVNRREDLPDFDKLSKNDTIEEVLEDT